MKFDLSKYETVKSRKKKFYLDYPDGRIIVTDITPSAEKLNFAQMEAKLYKNVKEQEKGLAFSSGYALELRDKELKISKFNKKYESVNFASWTENCEESAIGRALDNAGYAGNDKCSKEEMVIAEKNQKVLKKRTVKNKINKKKMNNEFELRKKCLELFVINKFNINSFSVFAKTLKNVNYEQLKTELEIYMDSGEFLTFLRKYETFARKNHLMIFAEEKCEGENKETKKNAGSDSDTEFEVIDRDDGSVEKNTENIEFLKKMEELFKSVFPKINFEVLEKYLEKEECNFSKIEVALKIFIEHKVKTAEFITIEKFAEVFLKKSFVEDEKNV